MERRNLRVAVSDIDVGPRLRKIDMDWARWIASSMKDLDAANPGYGQQTPIEVRPGGLEKGRYTLTAGAHRLEAVKINGWTEIEVAVVEVKDLEAELREIDENLFRRDLGALDRATFLARRQEVFWELHPETKRGTAGANARWNAADNLSFASQVALKLGVTPRDVRRSIARFTQIAADVREKIAGTWIAEKGSELDSLARLGPAEQRQVIALMLRDETPARSVKEAARLLSDTPPPVSDITAEDLRRLTEAWRKACAPARRQFLEFLEGQSGLRVIRTEAA